MRKPASYGPLIVLAGALVMAIAPFTAIAFGDSLFVQTHRDLMWSLDAPIYAIAMVPPVLLVVVAVLALAFPRSAVFRGLLGMAAVMAVAVAAGTWVFVLGVDGPQTRAAFVNAAITLTVAAIAITVGGLRSLQPRLSLAEADRPITTVGPLLIVAGAVCLAAAPFVFLAFGDDTNRYVIEQRHRLWIDLPQYVAGVLPAVAAFVFAVAAFIRRRSAVVATALLGVGLSTTLLAVLSFWWLQGSDRPPGHGGCAAAQHRRPGRRRCGRVDRDRGALLRQPASAQWRDREPAGDAPGRPGLLRVSLT